MEGKEFESIYLLTQGSVILYKNFKIDKMVQNDQNQISKKSVLKSKPILTITKDNFIGFKEYIGDMEKSYFTSVVS